MPNVVKNSSALSPDLKSFGCGTCDNFCPGDEAKLRISERILHFYELKNGQRDVPGILVKAFSRSAAGHKAQRTKDLRTQSCLQRTVEYLLKDIVLDKRKPFNFVYDFIFDRLRAVRQEIVIQNFDDQTTIKLMEPIIMFLAYSSYRLCEEPIDNFDPKICDQHLQECLKRILCCYDKIDSEKITLQQFHNRCFIEALYMIFNIGSTEVLRRCISLPSEIRTDAIVKSAFTIGMNHNAGNLYRVLNEIKALPHILCAVASLQLQKIRRNLYEIFAHAYSSKQLTVDAQFLCRLTIRQDINELFADCKYYNLRVAADRKGVNFVKTDFNSKPALKSKHEYFVEDKLKLIYLPAILLLKKL